MYHRVSKVVTLYPGSLVDDASCHCPFDNFLSAAFFESYMNIHVDPVQLALYASISFSKNMPISGCLR